MKSKNKLLFIFISFSILITGCHPGYIVPGEVNVFSKSPIVHPGCSHLVIFPFKKSEKQDGIHPSLNVAKLFNQEISRNNNVNKITLIEDKSLFSNMEEVELQIQRALYIANNKKAGLMMLRSIDYYYDSVSKDTKVIVSTMIVSVKTGKKLWWGTEQVTGKNSSFSGII